MLQTVFLHRHDRAGIARETRLVFLAGENLGDQLFQRMTGNAQNPQQAPNPAPTRQGNAVERNEVDVLANQVTSDIASRRESMKGLPPNVLQSFDGHIARYLLTLTTGADEQGAFDANRNRVIEGRADNLQTEFGRYRKTALDGVQKLLDQYSGAEKSVEGEAKRRIKEAAKKKITLDEQLSHIAAERRKIEESRQAPEVALEGVDTPAGIRTHLDAFNAKAKEIQKKGDDLGKLFGEASLLPEKWNKYLDPSTVDKVAGGAIGVGAAAVMMGAAVPGLNIAVGGALVVFAAYKFIKAAAEQREHEQKAKEVNAQVDAVQRAITAARERIAAKHAALIDEGKRVGDAPHALLEKDTQEITRHRGELAERRREQEVARGEAGRANEQVAEQDQLLIEQRMQLREQDVALTQQERELRNRERDVQGERAAFTRNTQALTDQRTDVQQELSNQNLPDSKRKELQSRLEQINSALARLERAGSSVGERRARINAASETMRRQRQQVQEGSAAITQHRFEMDASRTNIQSFISSLNEQNLSIEEREKALAEFQEARTVELGQQSTLIADGVVRGLLGNEQTIGTTDHFIQELNSNDPETGEKKFRVTPRGIFQNSWLNTWHSIGQGWKDLWTGVGTGFGALSDKTFLAGLGEAVGGLGEAMTHMAMDPIKTAEGLASMTGVLGVQKFLEAWKGMWDFVTAKDEFDKVEKKEEGASGERAWGKRVGNVLTMLLPGAGAGSKVAGASFRTSRAAGQSVIMASAKATFTGASVTIGKSAYEIAAMPFKIGAGAGTAVLRGLSYTLSGAKYAVGLRAAPLTEAALAAKVMKLGEGVSAAELRLSKAKSPSEIATCELQVAKAREVMKDAARQSEEMRVTQRVEETTASLRASKERGGSNLTPELQDRARVAQGMAERSRLRGSVEQTAARAETLARECGTYKASVGGKTVAELAKEHPRGMEGVAAMSEAGLAAALGASAWSPVAMYRVVKIRGKLHEFQTAQSRAAMAKDLKEMHPTNYNETGNFCKQAVEKGYFKNEAAARAYLMEKIVGYKLTAAEAEAMWAAHQLEGFGEGITLGQTKAKYQEVIDVFAQRYRRKGVTETEARRLAREDIRKGMDRGVMGKELPPISQKGLETLIGKEVEVIYTDLTGSRQRGKMTINEVRKDGFSGYFTSSNGEQLGGSFSYKEIAWPKKAKTRNAPSNAPAAPLTKGPTTPSKKSAATTEWRTIGTDEVLLPPELPKKVRYRGSDAWEMVNIDGKGNVYIRRKEGIGTGGKWVSANELKTLDAKKKAPGREKPSETPAPSGRLGAMRRQLENNRANLSPSEIQTMGRKIPSPQKAEPTAPKPLAKAPQGSLPPDPLVIPWQGAEHLDLPGMVTRTGKKMGWDNMTNWEVSPIWNSVLKPTGNAALNLGRKIKDRPLDIALGPLKILKTWAVDNVIGRTYSTFQTGGSWLSPRTYIDTAGRFAGELTGVNILKRAAEGLYNKYTTPKPYATLLNEYAAQKATYMKLKDQVPMNTSEVAAALNTMKELGAKIKAEQRARLSPEFKNVRNDYLRRRNAGRNGVQPTEQVAPVQELASRPAPSIEEAGMDVKLQPADEGGVIAAARRERAGVRPDDGSAIPEQMNLRPAEEGGSISAARRQNAGVVEESIIPEGEIGLQPLERTTPGSAAPTLEVPAAPPATPASVTRGRNSLLEREGNSPTLSGETPPPREVSPGPREPLTANPKQRQVPVDEPVRLVPGEPVRAPARSANERKVIEGLEKHRTEPIELEMPVKGKKRTIEVVFKGVEGEYALFQPAKGGPVFRRKIDKMRYEPSTPSIPKLDTLPAHKNVIQRMRDGKEFKWVDKKTGEHFRAKLLSENGVDGVYNIEITLKNGQKKILTVPQSKLRTIRKEMIDQPEKLVMPGKEIIDQPSVLVMPEAPGSVSAQKPPVVPGSPTLGPAFTSPAQPSRVMKPLSEAPKTNPLKTSPTTEPVYVIWAKEGNKRLTKTLPEATPAELTAYLNEMYELHGPNSTHPILNAIRSELQTRTTPTANASRSHLPDRPPPYTTPDGTAFGFHRAEHGEIGRKIIDKNVMWVRGNGVPINSHVRFRNGHFEVQQVSNNGMLTGPIEVLEGDFWVTGNVGSRFFVTTRRAPPPSPSARTAASSEAQSLVGRPGQSEALTRQAPAAPNTHVEAGNMQGNSPVKNAPKPVIETSPTVNGLSPERVQLLNALNDLRESKQSVHIPATKHNPPIDAIIRRVRLNKDGTKVTIDFMLPDSNIAMGKRTSRTVNLDKFRKENPDITI